MVRPISSTSHRVDLNSEPPFHLGLARIDPQAHEYTIGDSSTRMQPQTLKVLVALHDKAGQVVTRDELVDRCWDGRIVGDDVINRCISLLRPVAAQGGFSIETIPRSGYRLIEFDVVSRGQHASKPYQLSGWGDLRISFHGSDCTPRSRKARALVAYLASHPDKEFRRERIAELLWSDRGEEQARASLRQVLLELKPLTETEPPVLRADRNQLSFNDAAFGTRPAELSALAEEAPVETFYRELPGCVERYFADLDTVSETFDDWLASERSLRIDELSNLVQGAAARARDEGDTVRMRAFENWLRSFDSAWDGRLPDAASMVANAPQPALESPEQTLRFGGVPIYSLVAAAILLVGIAAWFLLMGRPASARPSIAVLPFESIPASSNTYLADGISEEIMTRLAENPNERVVGRTSAWSFRGQALDAQDIGSKLGVDYLVEGSLQSDNSQVRVDVSLLLVRDGTRLWTERFVGGRNDVFAIQDRIGQAISSRIGTGGRSLISSPVSGAAHMLVLTSRGLLLGREPAKFDAAVTLLRQATAIDPHYAEAWAMLARALLYRARDFPDSAADPSIDPDVLPDVRRALALKPDLAEGHLVLGMIPSPPQQRRAELAKAIKLDPSDPESWYALSRLDRFDGNYDREYDDLKHADLLDPLWHRSAVGAADSAWDFGHFNASDAYSIKAQRGLGPASLEGRLQEADRARRRGDYAAAAAAAQRAGQAAPKSSTFFRDLVLAVAFRSAGDYDRAQPLWRMYKVDKLMWRMWHGEPPAPSEFAAILRDPVKGAGQEERTSFILATLIGAGRNEDVTRLFAMRPVCRTPRCCARQHYTLWRCARPAIPSSRNSCSSWRMTQFARLPSRAACRTGTTP
jgi:TolB-like protein/DNA-binding winged helix-turn-helix (wHTH) protein/tetratricopeptide (TPR) repeat protein